MRLLKKKNNQSQKEFLYNPPSMSWQPDFSKWSIDKKKEEYQKCKSNPIYWAKNYGVIQHPHKGKLPFKLFPFQELILKSFFKVDNLVVNKSRQMGISTLIAGFSFWLASFYNDKNILIIATKGEVAKNIVKKVKIFYQFSPKWLKPQIVAWNVFSITFSNGSVIKASTTTIDAARSEALSLLIIDEAAHISKLSEIWTAAFPTLSTGGKAIMLSSPNGAQGFFYELCRDASTEVVLPTDPKSTDTSLNIKRIKEGEEDSTNFTLITLPWNYHPERDDAWFKGACQEAKYDWRKISQEYLCSFEGSGKKVIEPKLLQEIRERLIKPDLFDQKQEIIDSILSTYSDTLKEILNVEGDTLEGEKIRLKNLLMTSAKFFALPTASTMVAGVDVASGGGSDYSTMVLGDLQKDIFCSLQIKTDTKTFSLLVFLLASYYNRASLYIESNSYGNDVLIRLTDDYYYENVQKNEKGLFGFFTHTKSRQLLISDFIAIMNYPDINKKPKINDIRIYMELENFVWSKSGKPQADGDCNDDFVIALALYLFGTKSLGVETNDTMLMPVKGESDFNVMEEANKHLTINWTDVIAKYKLYNINMKEFKDDFDTAYLEFLNSLTDEAKTQMDQYKELGIQVAPIEEIVLQKLLRKKNII